MPKDLLDDFLRFCDRMLLGIENDERPAQKYKATLGLISQILATTHGMVVDSIDRLEKATTIGEATAILDELNYGPLTESFRVQGLCETFEGLGSALRNLNNQAVSTNAFTNHEMGRIAELAQALTDREMEVSRLYVNGIQGLSDLVFGPRTDLREIRSRARTARDLLTHQMTDFDSRSRQLLRIGRS